MTNQRPGEALQPFLFFAYGEGTIDQRPCYCKEDIQQAYLDFVLGGDKNAQHGDELASFMEHFEDGDEWVLDTFFDCDIGETGHVRVVRVDCAPQSAPAPLPADARAVAEKYEIQRISDGKQYGAHIHFRITDKETDSRVATCYARENAELVVSALNAASLPADASQPALSVPEAVLDAYTKCAEICKQAKLPRGVGGRVQDKAADDILAARDALRGKS